jgi:cytochrome c biogenesis protein CcdA
VFSRAHISARVAALAAVLLGLWLLKDFFLPGWGPRLQAPAKVGELIARTGRKATVPALAVGGMLIALCTVPCSGAVYLAVLALLAAQPSAAAGYGYLLVYNLVFIAPLVGILLAAGSRPALTQVKRWHTYHGRSLRLVLGALSVLLGLLVLAMV